MIHFPNTAVGEAQRQIKAHGGFIPLSSTSSSSSSSTSLSGLTSLSSPPPPSSSSSNSSSPSSSSSSSVTPQQSGASKSQASALPYLTGGIDSLVNASKHSCEHTLMAFYPLLCPSAPFVVYYQHIEPLTALGRKLIVEG